MKRDILLVLIWMLGWLNACSWQGAVNTPLPPTATAALPTARPSPTTGALDTPSGPIRLRIWLPPEFDPAAETPAAAVLQQRLDEFVKRRPDVHLEVRVKALSGTGGVIDALSTSTAVAPLALPGLVALPRDLLEVAALKGLLHSYDRLTPSMESTDWFTYAKQMAYVQNSLFGLPFAGDALVLVYRQGALKELPTDWNSFLSLNVPMVFPAADPAALVTIAYYQARQGELLDSQGRPYLDGGVLEAVLTDFAHAEEAGLMPYWLTQYQTDEQAWEALQQKRADLAIAWSSYYLKESTPELTLAPLPTPSGSLFTLATGWVWALVEDDPTRQALYVELAEYLTEASFLAEWTHALGYLPPRSSALQSWDDEQLRVALSRVSFSARLPPTEDVLAILSLPLQQATIQVLKKQADPASAAQAALQSLGLP